MPELDPRVIKISVQINGVIKTYTDLMIEAQCTKFANPNQNEAEIKIYNLDNATVNYLLSETSPFNLNKTPKNIFVDAGRISYGTSRIYVGNIYTAHLTQPPDIAIVLKCLTGNFQKGNILSRNYTSNAQLSKISQGIANDLGVTLNFQATDKNIGNYTFTGGALKQVDQLQDAGNVNAYVDDEQLIVKNYNVPLTNRLKLISQDTGMIGIPSVTEQGIRVKFLLDNQTVLGGGLRIQSTQYSAINGEYVIYKLGFDIATRDTPFYWIAEAKRI